MTGLILAIYDFFDSRRWVAALLLIVSVLACVVLSLSLKYGENITDFLPKSDESGRYSRVYSQLGDQGTVTVIFRPVTHEGREQVSMAMATYDELWQTCSNEWEWNGGEKPALECLVDENRTFEAMDAIGDNIPLHLTATDYQRIDSLLALPGYIDTCLQSIRGMLSFPMSSLQLQAVSSDPLNLFTPAFQRLSSLGVGDKYNADEGVVMDYDGNGYAFLHVPWISSDTRSYSLLSERLARLADSVENRLNGVTVSAVGAGLIAATNAAQIKRDSFLALAVASILILAILLFTMGRRRNIVWLVASVALGWLFALGVIAVIKPTLSIIVVGIGSVLIGIAVNYPLHFLDHVRDHPDRREALKEMVEPLLTGNITTVSAFACLLFVKAEAMRDLGLFGALMLAGTIVVVMVWLPHVAAVGRRKHDDVESSTVRDGSCLQTTDHAKAAGYSQQRKNIRAVYVLVVVMITIVLGWLSTRTQFDGDLHNINYMTDQQRGDLNLLGASDTNNRGRGMLYLVAEGCSLDSALVVNERYLSLLKFSDECKVSGVVGLLQSSRSVHASLRRWQQFCDHYAHLTDTVKHKSASLGFSEHAFAPFYRRMAHDYSECDTAGQSILLALCRSHVLQDSGNTSVVTFVEGDTLVLRHLKETVRNAGCDACFAFDSSDVGTNLVSDLQADFNYILYVCGFVVFFFLWLSLGRIELAVLSFIPLTVGWLWILGLMDIAGVKFNIVNIILATFIFGQGDDYTIFITEGLMYEYAYGKKRLRSYRRSVIISAALMFAGIGVLVFAKHPAMRSLGQVAVIGMFVVILMACTLPPVIFRWFTMKNGRRRDVPVTLGQFLRSVLAIIHYVVVVMLVVTPLTCIYRMVAGTGARARLLYHRFICWLVRGSMRMLPQVKISTINQVGENFSRPSVVIANHQSFLDLPLVMRLHPRLIILTNDRVWRNPVYGIPIRYAQFYPVGTGYEALIDHLRGLVAQGYSIMLFPEGTRSVDGSLGRMRSGAFKLAKDLSLDIVPLYIHGAGKILPKKESLIRKGSVTVEIGKRIPFVTFADIPVRTLASNIHGLYEEHLKSMAEQLEDEKYFLPYVRAQYLYKGRDIWRRARKALRSIPSSDSAIPAGQGEVALLRALSHRDIEYHVTFDNEDDYLVACHAGQIPPNLHYELVATVGQ